MSTQNAIALCDVNSFYASCHQLFRPDLKNKPVVVLSNNDGAIVARSSQAKQLGIKMAQPYFEIKELCQRENVSVFSSNYPLYADISARVMTTLSSFAPQCEQYSIDEMFLDLDRMAYLSDLDDYGRQIKSAIDRNVGVPIGVGIANTKTLAKLANYAAKKYPATGGVVHLHDTKRIQRLMQITPVGEVWGIGRRIARRLNSAGVTTVADFAALPSKAVRQEFSVVLERTHAELNGERCIPLELETATRKQIVKSRSFGQRVTDIEVAISAITSFCHSLSRQLRAEGLKGRVLTAFICTSPFAETEPYYGNSNTTQLALPTNDTRTITSAAIKSLRVIWRDGYRFAKAGVVLTDISEASKEQGDLFSEPDTTARINSILDKINRSPSGKHIRLANSLYTGWEMKADHRSPSYTTSWCDLPEARCN